MIHCGGATAKEGELDKIIFKAKDKGLANFVINGEFYSDKAQLIQTNFENLQLQIGKEETNIEMQAEAEQGSNTQMDNELFYLDPANANLEILAIENYLLYPPFEKSITQYTTQVSNDAEKLNIFAVTENEQGKVTISGNENLKEGNNLITVTSTAPNGITKRDYEINVYKRNVGEEEQFKKQQEELQQKLEEAYEVEKTSTAQTEQNKNLYWLIGGGNLVVAVVGYVIYKRYRKK